MLYLLYSVTYYITIVATVRHNGLAFILKLFE